MLHESDMFYQPLTRQFPFVLIIILGAGSLGKHQRIFNEMLNDVDWTMLLVSI